MEPIYYNAKTISYYIITPLVILLDITKCANAFRLNNVAITKI